MSAIWSLWKIYKSLFIPNCKSKIMWLLINNIHEKISRWLSRRNARVSRNQEKLRHQLRHPGIHLKAKDLIGHLWVSLIIDQSERLVCFLFLHWINSFLHCLKKHCTALIQSEWKNFFMYIIRSEIEYGLFTRELIMRHGPVSQKSQNILGVTISFISLLRRGP